MGLREYGVEMSIIQIPIYSVAGAFIYRKEKVTTNVIRRQSIQWKSEGLERINNMIEKESGIGWTITEIERNKGVLRN